MISRRFDKLSIFRWLKVASIEELSYNRTIWNARRNYTAGLSATSENVIPVVKFLSKSNVRLYSQTTSSCPKCGHSSVSVFKCLQCDSLILPSTEKTLFDVLGQKVSYDLTESELKKEHHKLQAEFHPDKYSQKDPDERAKSEEISSLINKAYFTLSDPYERGMYLLQLKNQPLNEGDIQLATDFLIAIMERNEELENINSREELKEFENSNDKEIQKLSSHISEAFAGNNLALAKSDLHKMKYFISIRKRLKEMERNMDVITGVVVITTSQQIKHNGITLSMEGLVSLQLSPKNVGIFEAFYNSVKPVQICNALVDISGPNTIPQGKTDIPFEVPLVAKPNRIMHETYHGVFINIQYTLKCELKRGFMLKDMVKVAEFIVEYRGKKPQAEIKPVNFVITPDSLEGGVDLGTIPGFRISGVIDSTICNISKPFTGQITIQHSEIPIKSIELQLVRVETCGCAEGYAKDVTEIQNIQIGEGNVACGIAIPIYMIFPRLFTCPSLATNNFKVEFEVNVVVVFENDHLVSENFPITLIRA